MPLLYPVAPNAREALDAEGGARTIAEARELANGPVALVSDWLRPQPAEREELQRKAEAGIARGFVQVYEDAKGNPVIAVAYWKPGAERPVAPKRPQPETGAGRPDDHTDDLYFTRTDARVKRRKKAGDPNQLDMFGAGGAAEDAGDAPGPGVVILDDESDSADDQAT